MNDSAPVNVKLEKPSVEHEGWDKEASLWKEINTEIGGHPGFFPLTVKAAYVVGVIHTICQSVSILLNAKSARFVSYIPAYGVFASGIELLGRCIRGNSSTHGSTKDLESGFKWLASTYFDEYKENHENVIPEVILVQTSKNLYSINNLVALRHFAAHGQATSNEYIDGHGNTLGYHINTVDDEILKELPIWMGRGMEKFWSNLQTSEGLCNNLALANVIPLRKWPIFLSWKLFEADDDGKYHSVYDIFNRFDWSIKEFQ